MSNLSKQVMSPRMITEGCVGMSGCQTRPDKPCFMGVHHLALVIIFSPLLFELEMGVKLRIMYNCVSVD